MALVTALETTLDAAAAANAEPGRRSFQRLNRAEYAAAVRDAVRPRHRRQRVSARRHDQRQLRQHRRRADAVRDGDAGLHARGRATSAASPWATRRSTPSSTHVRRAAHAVAEGPRRGRAVRHARRHRRHAQLPGRRQIQVPAAAARRADRASCSAAPSRDDPDGSGDRRRARGAREGRSLDVGIGSRRAHAVDAADLRARRRAHAWRPRSSRSSKARKTI